MLVKMSSNTPQKLLHGHGWTAPEFLDAVFKNPESVDAFSSMLTQEDHESIFAAIAAREEELKESIPELRKEASSTEGSESMGTCGNPKTSDREADVIEDALQSQLSPTTAPAANGKDDNTTNLQASEDAISPPKNQQLQIELASPWSTMPQLHKLITAPMDPNFLIPPIDPNLLLPAPTKRPPVAPHEDERPAKTANVGQGDATPDMQLISQPGSRPPAAASTQMTSVCFYRELAHEGISTITYNATTPAPSFNNLFSLEALRGCIVIALNPETNTYQPQLNFQGEAYGWVDDNSFHLKALLGSNHQVGAMVQWGEIHFYREEANIVALGRVVWWVGSCAIPRKEGPYA